MVRLAFARLLGENRRLLEADVAEHGDYGQYPEGAEASRGEGGRGKRRETELAACRMNKARYRLGEDDDDLRG